MVIGNLGDDPDIKTVGNNNAKVANLSVAATERYKDRDGNKKEITEWFDVEFWNKTAEVCENYLSKGDKVYIEGKQKTDSWQDDSGNNRYKKKVRGLNLVMLGNASGGNQNQSQKSSGKSQNKPQSNQSANQDSGGGIGQDDLNDLPDDDDLPF